MPTFKSEFQDLADELASSSGEFADFRRALTIGTQSVYDPITDSEVAGSFESGQAIGPLSYSINEIDGTNIQSGDFKVIMVANEWSSKPSIEHVNSTYDGEPMDIISVSEDAANATYTLQCRYK